MICGVGVLDIAGASGGIFKDNYNLWRTMISRCYGSSSQSKFYEGVTVCAEWHKFSHFNDWLAGKNFKGLHLDKDILNFKGNLYCPEYCVFVPQKINKLFTDRFAKRGMLPLGVSLRQDNDSNPYRAYISGGRRNTYQALGCFKTPEEAHKRWQAAKIKRMHEFANWWKSSGCPSFDLKVYFAILDRAKLIQDAMNQNEITLYY